MTSTSYFGKQNSTIGSVVPLAMFYICVCEFVYLYLCICIFVFAERGEEEAETCEERETEDGQKCKSHVNLGSGHSGHCQSIGRRDQEKQQAIFWNVGRFLSESRHSRYRSLMTSVKKHSHQKIVNSKPNVTFILFFSG